MTQFFIVFKIPETELPVGCRAEPHTANRWLVPAWLLGAQRTSTKNRFRRTNPVRRNTPKRADCAGLGTGAARAAHTRRASVTPRPSRVRRARRRSSGAVAAAATAAAAVVCVCESWRSADQKTPADALNKQLAFY